jgi:hypothetical protein
MISRLFLVPLGEFIGARNALAKELRDEGHAEEAKRVQAMRKPSVSLWLVNQLGRKAPAAVSALIATTEKMREVTRHGGPGDELRKAMREQHEALQKLIAAASGLSETSLSLPVQRKIQHTLQAAAMKDPDALREGRLESELEAAGFDAALSDGVAPPLPPKKVSDELSRELRAAEKKAHALAAAAEEAAHDAAKAEEAAVKARERARVAREAADAAAARVLDLGRKR